MISSHSHWHVVNLLLRCYKIARTINGLWHLFNTFGALLKLASMGFSSRIISSQHRPQRSIETIPSFDQWSLTIENHWNQWLDNPKTIEKPSLSMVSIPKNIQWWWCPPKPLKIFNGLFKTIEIFNGLFKIIRNVNCLIKIIEIVNILYRKLKLLVVTITHLNLL